MHLIFTADPNLTTVITQVTSYFTSNFPPVLAAVLGIAMLFWFLKITMHSFGIHGGGWNTEDGFYYYQEEDVGEQMQLFGEPMGFDIFWD